MRFRSRWYHLDLPRHRFHFTERALRKALETTGFAVLGSSTSTTSLSIIGSLEYLMIGHHARGQMGRNVLAVVAAALYPFTAAVTWLMGAGDILHFAAIKPQRDM
jgi:hypothetical protein